MKVRSILTGKIFEGEWRRESPIHSIDPQPVLVITETGEAADPAFFKILKEGERINSLKTSREQPRARLLTRKEISELFKISLRTVDDWCSRGILPFESYPCGKRFDPDKIRAFRESREFNHR